MNTASGPRSTWQEFLDSSVGMSGRQRLVVALAFMALVAEGLDITIASFVYPQIIRDWGTSLEAITGTVTIGVLGLALGGAVAGPLADRYGRKGTAIVGIVVFALATAAMALTTSIGPFTTLRILACLGLGGAMPVLLTIVADAVPGDRRAQMVSLSFSGVAVGTIMGGFLSSAIIPTFGWSALLLLCGLPGLLLAPALAVLVPESPGALVARGRPVDEARRALERLAPGCDSSTVDFAVSADTPRRPRSATIAIAFSGRLALTTVLLWLAFFIGLGIVFLILNYLPLIVGQQGFSTAQIGVIAGMFGWGGLVGQILVSFALRRVDRFVVLAVVWAFGLVGILVVAAFTFGFLGLSLSVFGLGLCLSSATATLNATGALAYPPEVRATGMGWASGAGRLGTLATGLIGGLMLAAGWRINEIFLVMGAPVAIGILIALVLRADHRRRERADAAERGAASPGDRGTAPATGPHQRGAVAP